VNRLASTWLLVTAAVMGAVVMAVELLGARLLGVAYGGSLAVWAAMIAVTLLSLSIGYFAGGWAADRRPHPGVLYGILLVAAALVILCPHTRFVLKACHDAMGIQGGALASSAIVFSLPLGLMGVTGPFVIRLLCAGTSPGPEFSVVGGTRSEETRQRFITEESPQARAALTEDQIQPRPPSAAGLESCPQPPKCPSDPASHEGERPAWRPTWLGGTLAGVPSGVTTMLAHAAGPVLTMYLLPQNLDRRDFVGTTVRYFLVFNLLKIPLFLTIPGEARLNWDIFKSELWILALAPLGVWAGRWLNDRLSQKWFNHLLYLFLTLAGVQLIWNGANSLWPR
jgi:hypothetical protein